MKGKKERERERGAERQRKGCCQIEVVIGREKRIERERQKETDRETER